MDFQEFSRTKDEYSRLCEAGKYKEAYDILQPLLMMDISEIDKAAICIKLARIADRNRNTEEALNWLDRGMGYEQPYYRYETAEEKVRYLAQIGRYQEGVPIYESLLKLPCVTELEKDRIRKEIKSLLSRTIGQWG